MLYIIGWLYGCIYIYIAFILLLDLSFHKSVLISMFYGLIYLIRLYIGPNAHLNFYCMTCIFPSLSLLFMLFFIIKWASYTWVLFLIHLDYVFWLVELMHLNSGLLSLGMNFHLSFCVICAFIALFVFFSVYFRACSFMPFDSGEQTI